MPKNVTVGENKTLGIKMGLTKKSRRKGMKETFIAITRLTRSPVFNVVAVVILILGVFVGLRILRERRDPAQLSFVESNSPDQILSENAEHKVSAAPEIFSGEVYDTSIRLRETAAMGIAISLAVFAEYSEKKAVPTTLEGTLAAIAHRNLLPPGLILTNGGLSSTSSILTFRYQPQPLRFEILSRPKPDMQGPALMLRFPLTTMNGQTLSYFQSSIARRYDVPEPFAETDQIITSGWTLEQWRGELLPFDKNLLNALGEEQKGWNADRKQR
ncbi:MAG: hypothetical protein WBD27_06990 [Pyrinomonadaceae bacterium]